MRPAQVVYYLTVLWPCSRYLSKACNYEVNCEIRICFSATLKAKVSFNSICF